MNTTKLKVLLGVLEHGNLSKAAKEFNYTQSAVSHMVASLEEEFGFLLLQRTSEGIHPTDEAQRILPYVQNICHNENSLYEEVNRINCIEAGHINIGTYYSVMQNMLPTLLETFCKNHPNILVNLLEDNTTALAGYIKNSTVDFAFTSQVGFEAYEFYPIIKDRIVVALPENHPLTAKDTIDPLELCKYPIISMEEGSDHELISVFEAVGLTPQIKYRAKSEMSILSMVACNMGVGIVSALFLEHGKPGIVVRELDEAYAQYFSRDIGVSLLSKNTLSPSSVQFLKEIGAIV